MKKELKIAFIIIILFFLAFIFLVKYTENINNSNIINSAVNLYVQGSPYEAIMYQNSKVNLWLLNLAWGAIIPLIFLFTGLSANIRYRIQSNLRSFLMIVILYFITYTAINYLLSLPLEYYGGYFLKHSYGLSNQEFLKWFTDSLKGFCISTLFGAATVSICFLIIRSSLNYWWLYVGILSIPILFFVTFVSPLYIDPIFNKYESITDSNLESKIYDELKTAGIENCKVYMVNKSVDTNEMNAYMTGVLSTKRIVLWDTTIKNLSQRETLCVVAHEIGHYVMGHIWKAILLGGLLNIVLLFFINKTVLWIIAKSNGVWGFNSLKDIASLPLLILVINLYIFIITPGVNAYTRHTEREADRFEIELTKDNSASATSTIKLHQGSLVLPSPGIVYKLWNYDHPTFKERLDFANSYAPWKEGKPLKYEKYFEKR